MNGMNALKENMVLCATWAPKGEDGLLQPGKEPSPEHDGAGVLRLAASLTLGETSVADEHLFSVTLLQQSDLNTTGQQQVRMWGKETSHPLLGGI